MPRGAEFQQLLNDWNALGNVWSAGTTSTTTQQAHTAEIKLPHKVPVTVVEPIPEIKSLAHKANQVLGYNRLALAIKDELAKTLKELDIEILDEVSVEDYKKAKTVRKLGSQVGWETEWRRIPISKYTRPIPEYVLNKAVQIKEALSTVEVFVDEMEVNRIPDPFLVVAYQNEVYYVEVWDEPKFEGRITK